MNLHDLHDIASGDPARIRAESARMGAVCDQIATVAARLRQVSTRGVWDSGAGETFAARVGEVPDSLDAVRVRLQAAANLLPPYAALLADSQERMRELDDRYARARDVMHECDRRLETLPPDAPERPHLLARRGEASRQSYAAQEAFLQAGEEAVDDEKRLASRLYDVCPELADPKGYDLLEGLSSFGSGPVVNNPATDVFRAAKVARFATPLGEMGQLLVYDEGSWAEVAASAKTALLGIVRLPKGVGAVADDVTRRAERARELAARAPRAAPIAVAGGRIARMREKVRASAKQAVKEAPVRAKHAAQDRFEDATGIRMITNMTSDWAALAGAGPMKKAAHIAAYTLVAGKKVDTTIGHAQTTGEALRRQRRPDERKSVATTPDRCNR